MSPPIFATMTNGALSEAYDEPNGCLRTVTVEGQASENHVAYDENYVWSNVFDPATGSLRVIEVWMPRYDYVCGMCDELTEIVASIGTARRMRECECGGVARLRIGVDVNIAPSALEHKGANVRAIDTKEGRWDRDMPAYKRMRRNGMQPKSVDGAAALEEQVGDQFDVQYKPLMDRGIPRKRIQEGAEQAQEMLEDAGMTWHGTPV